MVNVYFFMTDLKTADFDYHLPKEFIAVNPAVPRDSSKLMVVDTKNGTISHRIFRDLTEYVDSNDVLVVNRSKVIPARILFDLNGKKCEIFVLKNIGGGVYHVLVKPGKVFKVGYRFNVNDNLSGLVTKVFEDGSRYVEFSVSSGVLEHVVEMAGIVPLPPYIKNSKAKLSDYQTVYALEKGSVAAPTAGLHFTPELIRTICEKGSGFLEVLLHVGRGTFLPVTASNIADHVMHGEYYELSPELALALNKAKSDGKRIIAVGTTSVRVLESSFKNGSFEPKTEETSIFIYPGYKWKVVSGLITNFHLPKSTLIMLVASFLESKGVKNPVEEILRLYEVAKENGYRFYSFGDAMLII